MLYISEARVIEGIKMADLSILLRKLCSDTWKVVDKHRREKKVKRLKRVYVTYRIKKFEYKKGGGISSQGSFSNTEKEEWDWGELFKLTDTINKLSIYTKVYKTISRNYEKTEPQAEHWLSRFIQIFVTEALNERVTDETITDLIVTFIGDLEGNPRQWKLKIWLDGIWLEVDEIQVDEGIIIRRPQPADFEFEYPLDQPFLVRQQPLLHPSAILEINKRVKITPYVYDELERIILTLRLYKIGSIFRMRTSWQPKSILSFGGETGRRSGWVSSYKYPITKSDLDHLPTFAKRIKPLIPIEGDFARLNMSRFSGIAVQRYSDALLKPEPNENKLAYAIMGLEALYLKKTERAELSRRLGQRAATVLKSYGKSPVKVFNILIRAYEIRSDFVHGSPLHEEKPQEMKALLDNVLEYLRLSLLIFLILSEKVEKERILTLIDNAMLERHALEKLEKFFANARIDFA